MSNGILNDNNQKWISLILTISFPAALGIGGLLYNSQQDQIDRLKDQVWEQQRVSVTDEKLNREIERVIDIVDLKLSSIEERQDQMSKQLQVFIEQDREFKKEMREELFNQN